MTPQEITAHALALGITREAFPEFFTLEHISCEAAFCHCKGAGQTFYTCTLPDPDSDDPRCPLWDGFYMRALGWPTMCVYTGIDVRVEYKVNDRIGATWERTPTAALRAAWLAKDSTARRAAQRIGGDHG